MTALVTTLTRLALLAAAAAPLSLIVAIAHADDDIDVDNAEILDVVETTDGSVWKGVIIEQVPGTSIKIALSGGSVHVIQQRDIVRMARQKNPRRVTARPIAPIAPTTGPGPAGSGLPAPFARSGTRFGAGLLVVFPTGDWGERAVNLTTSFAPTVHLGFERLYGNFGISGGGRVTFIYFLNDVDSSDALWTLETHGYLRTTLHVGKFAPYAGLALGLDTNFAYFDSLDDSYFRLGPGVTLEAGADVAVSTSASLGIAGVLHPGTNALAAPDNVPTSALPDVSYFGLRLGATLRM